MVQLLVKALFLKSVTLYHVYCFKRAYWAPPEERSRLIGMSHSGGQIGNILALFAGGYLGTLDFGGGWPLIFYIYGNSYYILTYAKKYVLLKIAYNLDFYDSFFLFQKNP